MGLVAAVCRAIVENDGDFLRNELRGRVNGSQLLVQIAAVSVIGGILCLAFKGMDCGWIDEQMPWGGR
jgi:hypothetical protein